MQSFAVVVSCVLAAALVGSAVASGGYGGSHGGYGGSHGGYGGSHGGYGGSHGGHASYGAAPSYAAPAYVQPGPSYSYSYPSPAPAVKCGSNLLIGCSPHSQSVGCQSYAPHSYSAPSYSAPSYSAPSYSAPSYSKPAYWESSAPFNWILNENSSKLCLWLWQYSINVYDLGKKSTNFIHFYYFRNFSFA